MEKIQLTTCCGRYSLKTGTISIGVSEIVLTLLSTIITFMLNEESDSASTKDDTENKTTSINVVLSGSNCINILISTLLIIGALKKNTCMMQPWLILNIIITVFFSLFIIFVTISGFINGKVFISILALVIGLIFILIFSYLSLVVYSYITEIITEEINNRMDPCREPHNFQQV